MFIFYCEFLWDTTSNSGPDSQKIYDVDGYTTYLPKKFPKLDYIDRCYVVDEVGIADQSEGEF